MAGIAATVAEAQAAPPKVSLRAQAAKAPPTAAPAKAALTAPAAKAPLPAALAKAALTAQATKPAPPAAPAKAQAAPKAKVPAAVPKANGAAKAIMGLSRAGGRRYQRQTELRDVLQRAGQGDASKMAQAVVNTLGREERRALLNVLQTASGSAEVFCAALQTDAVEAPQQVVTSALARASQRLGWSKQRLKARLCIGIDNPMWERARDGPVRMLRHVGGRPQMAHSAALAVHVREFLLRHGSSTSRFCRAKARHIKARPGRLCGRFGHRPLRDSPWFQEF